MKITFLLPYAGMAGGIRVVAIYAAFLAEHGHEVNVVSVSQKAISFKEAVKGLVKGKTTMPGKQRQGSSHITNANSIQWTILEHNGPIKDKDVPDADVVIATWWKTAEWMNELSVAKGEKVYFCQHYENHEYFPNDRVEATYHHPFLQICVSEWVKNKIQKLTGNCTQEVVMNGVDSSQFISQEREMNNPIKVGFMYSPAHWKGTDILIKALQIAKKLDPKISAICFGANHPSKNLKIPHWIEFNKDPKQELIRDIYSQCDAWLFGSRSEGFGLPILEAMACRTPVIATPAGAATDIINKKNGFLVPHENPQAIAEKIMEISKMSQQQWKLLSDEAQSDAMKNDWNSAACAFEEALYKAVGS